MGWGVEKMRGMYLVKYPDDMSYFVDGEATQVYISKEEAVGRIQNVIDAMVEENEENVIEIAKEIEIYEIGEKLNMIFSVKLLNIED
jgi:hypothetical protein